MNHIIANVKFERKRLRDQYPTYLEDEINETVLQAMEEYVKNHFDPQDYRAITNLLKVYIPGTGYESTQPLPRRSELKLKEALSSFVPVVNTAKQEIEIIMSVTEMVKEMDSKRLRENLNVIE
ncbi:hypothetical protein BGZ76_004684 [Entomortierella beljakovae]|nr:hypothetical protein BGZ76_004684 [Entomortierella beljakovae]